jgi:predicted amidophosphoribosyltransferase
MSFFDPGNEGNETQKCPICGMELPASKRYKNYVCDKCIERAVDEDGKPASFYSEARRNEDGSFQTPYTLRKVCYIDGIKCRGQEAKFGGLVVEPVE